MRVPVAWLREYCDPPLDGREIAEALTMAGVKMEAFEAVGVGSPDSFVVGRVLESGRHPDAERLSVCRVDDGSGEPRTIVCGAPNVAAGQTVAVARPGAVMPDGATLGEATLRGVRSSGMILAEDELGIGVDHAGILVLDGDGLEPGTPLGSALPIADEVIEIEITPNRPDCMGVYGVARELHAVSAAPLAPDPTDADADPSGSDRAEDHARVEVDPDICLRFTARVFEDVTIGPSPAWLKQRLTAAGQRPISNVVDITNYAMLLCGQPLHAFDLDEVRGARLVVRRAREGERMTTLDGVERSLDPDVALVCDAEGPSGIAGVMGGQVSEVSEKTTRVLMEAATWVGPNILMTSRRLGLRTEASARFEKQLHPDTAMAAQRLAARLMVELCGARLVPGTIDAYPRPVPPRRVELRLERLERLLGERVPAERVEEILDRLGFAPARADGRVAVTVPPWRDGDVQREVDLIEEVARVHGLEKLPTTLPARREAAGRLLPEQRLRRRLEDGLRARGAAEVIAYSFTSPDALARLRLGELPPLRIANPLTEEVSALRPLRLPGLLDAARRNAAHGRDAVVLFESAHVYAAAGHAFEAPAGSPRGAAPTRERHHLGALLTEAQPATWRSPARPADLFAAKALLEATLADAGVEWRAEPGGEPFLHPGRAARIVAVGGHGGDASGPGGGAVELGWLGELHPLVARDSGLDGTVAAFELDLDALAPLALGRARAFRDVTSFPAVLQDIAVVVPEEVSAAQVEEAVRSGGGELLARAGVFDLYRGEQLGEGRKSLALRLEFRAPDRTLTDDEVAKRRAAIERELAAIGGRLRV
ncbi:MAG: phenylalanine--tRNA ligase subunit beta [Nocardioidaceae bacterium]